MKYLVISDIHANSVALQAVLDDAAGQYDSILFLGDIVDYGPDPVGCIDILMQSDVPVVGVRGNHDQVLIDGFGLERFNPDAAWAAAWTGNEMIGFDAHLQWVEALPEGPMQVEPGLWIVHGMPSDPIWGYCDNREVAGREVPYVAEEMMERGVVFFGHTHYAEEYAPEGADIALVNPGSVGQPRDGDPDAAYLLYDSETRIWEHRRVWYDWVKVQKAIFEAGLPISCAERICWGW